MTDRFDWSEQLQGFILASFYVGYMISQIPAGMIASKYGGKYVLLIGIGCNALLTLMTPSIVEVLGAPALVVIRIVIGIAEGLLFPSCNTLLAAWAPVNERSRMSTLAFSGAQVFYTHFQIFMKTYNFLIF